MFALPLRPLNLVRIGPIKFLLLLTCCWESWGRIKFLSGARHGSSVSPSKWLHITCFQCHYCLNDILSRVQFRGDSQDAEPLPRLCAIGARWRQLSAPQCYCYRRADSGAPFLWEILRTSPSLALTPLLLLSCHCFLIGFFIECFTDRPRALTALLCNSKTPPNCTLFARE